MMVSEFANLLGLSAHTLRYYDREGLLPFVERTPSGIRSFKESDIGWLEVITCLKQSGMRIKDIRQFIDWCMEGDTTLEKRLSFFLEHKKVVLNQIAELEKIRAKIDHKIWYYQTAVEAGTEDVHRAKPQQ